jgi:hypothetical protein
VRGLTTILVTRLPSQKGDGFAARKKRFASRNRARAPRVQSLIARLEGSAGNAAIRSALECELVIAHVAAESHRARYLAVWASDEIHFYFANGVIRGDCGCGRELCAPPRARRALAGVPRYTPARRIALGSAS